jgi:hypothetical protein
MNDQVNSLIRSVVAGVIWFGLGRHWFTVADAGTFGAALTTLLVAAVGAIPTIIGVIGHSKKAKLVSTAAISGVKAIIMDTKSGADAIPAANVIGPKDPIPGAAPSVPPKV